MVSYILLETTSIMLTVLCKTKLQSNVLDKLEYITRATLVTAKYVIRLHVVRDNDIMHCEIVTF